MQVIYTIPKLSDFPSIQRLVDDYKDIYGTNWQRDVKIKTKDDSM